MVILFLLWILLTPLLAMWRGYVLSILWGWFVAAYFGLPELGVTQAIGLSYVVMYLTASIPPKREKEPEGREYLIEQLSRIIVFHGFYPLLVLFSGWIVQKFL